MKDEIFTQAYNFEIDQMRHLDSKVNIPIIGVTVIGGALAGILSQFNYGSDWITWLFVALTAFTAVTLIIAIFFIFRSLSFGYYVRLPTETLFSHYAEEKGKPANHVSDTNDSLNTAVIKLLVEAASRNESVNQSRSRSIVLATSFLSFSLIFLGPGTGIYLVNHIHKEKQQVTTSTISTQKQK